jgi:thioredoxin reductase
MPRNQMASAGISIKRRYWWEVQLKTRVDVAIIGAGPYGLSIAAHLSAVDVEHRVFGVPMESWQAHMPPGMYLKSDPVYSNLSDPEANFTLEEYSREQRFAYDPYKIPVSLQNFISYGRAFQARWVPQVEVRRLVTLRTSNPGHELTFDYGELVIARNVVIATGVVPFKHTPTDLLHLPKTLVSHSGDYGPLDALKGKEVIILGSGSSALDLAALLSMQGSSVTVIARNPQLEFQPTPGSHNLSLLRRQLRRLYAPSSHGLGDGWHMRICAEAPQLFHVLPDKIRSAILSRTLGPSGGYFIRDQVEEKVTLKLGRVLKKAEEHRGRVRLTTITSNGAHETIDSDHIVAATGYKVDMHRLDFLSDSTLQGLRMVNNTPILSTDFESSVQGLYFVGLASARSFGPALRFVMGTVHPARRLARVLPGSLLRHSISMSAATSS